MKNNYFDLVEQSYYFPQEGFDLIDDYLTFHGVSLKYMIEKYGTPFKLIVSPPNWQANKEGPELIQSGY